MADGYQFDHLHLYCSDLTATERWLVGGIGATLIERRESSGTPSIVTELGGTRILLRPQRPNEALKPAVAGSYGLNHLALGVKDLDATAAELKRRGVHFEVEPSYLAGLYLAFVSGPDDVRIELVQR